MIFFYLESEISFSNLKIWNKISIVNTKVRFLRLNLHFENNILCLKSKFFLKNMLNVVFKLEIAFLKSKFYL